MICPRCGSDVPAGSPFCPRCDEPLVAPAPDGGGGPSRRARGMLAAAIGVAALALAALCVVVATLCTDQSEEGVEGGVSTCRFVLNAEIEGYSPSTDTPLPVRVTGTTDAGEEVTLTQGMYPGEPVTVEPGAYDATLFASPLTASGAVYLPSNLFFSFDSGDDSAPSDTEFTFGFDLEAVDPAEVTADELAALVDEAYEAALAVGVNPDRATELRDVARERYGVAREGSDGAGETASDGSAIADEASFVQAARAGLRVPDDPGVTYRIGGRSLWEGTGTYVWLIEFYQEGEAVASAFCTSDGAPVKSIAAYRAG